MRATIGGVGILEATALFPRSGSWVFEALLESDPLLPDGAPFTLVADNTPRLVGEVKRSVNVGGRPHFVGVSAGTTALDSPAAPLFSRFAQNRNVATQLLQQAKNLRPITWGPGAPVTLDSATLWPGITPRQWIGRQFDFMRFDWDSSPLIEAVNVTRTDHVFIGFSALDLSGVFGFGKRDFWLMPGQKCVIDGRPLQIASVQFHLDSQPRFVVKWEAAI